MRPALTRLGYYRAFPPDEYDRVVALDIKRADGVAVRRYLVGLMSGGMLDMTPSQHEAARFEDREDAHEMAALVRRLNPGLLVTVYKLIPRRTTP